MTSAKPQGMRFAWLGPVMGLLAVAACYGTLATVALLSIVGISVRIDEGLMTRLVSGMLVLVLFGMGYSYRLHRNRLPLLTALVASTLLLWAFFVSASKHLELAGFVVLGAASILDFRAKKRICTAHCHAANGGD